MKDNNPLGNPNKEQKIFKRSAEDIALKHSLLQAPELFIQDKESDEYLERIALKVRLIGDTILDLDTYVSQNLVEYRPHFYKDYYNEIARLYGIDESAMRSYIKPKCVAYFTLQFIYARFPKKVLLALRKKCPWTDIPGVRANKLFQHLSSTAIEQLDLYIDQAVETMKSSETIEEFQLEYSRKYKVYFQLALF